MKPGRAPDAAERSLAGLFAAGVLFLYLASAGGRITGSDEHTTFLLAQSLVERGSVAIPEGNGEPGPGGRLYAKAGLGQALAAAPFYLAGKLTSPLLPARLRGFYLRAWTSLLSPVAGAVTAWALVLVFLEMGLAPRGALALALAAALGTPLWVYAKLFLAEALLAACLALELLGVLRWRRDPADRRAAALAGLGLGLALLTKYAVLPAALLVALPALPRLRRWRPALAFAVVAGGFLGLALLYNALRSGSPLASGYGRQGTAAAFTTPLAVGLYGLLLSSGKGLLWFAPLAALVPAGLVAWWRADRVPAAAVGAALAATVLLYAGFEHWAGDGSWGPRYLVPLLPLAAAAVAARLAAPAAARRRLWWAAVAALGLAGAAVQAGGVAVSYGAQMREAGDYPYRRALDDPRFMSDSHWNPHYSPIAAHWRMAARNAAEHAGGRLPRVSLGAGAVPGRLGLAPAEAQALTRGFDVWAAYAVYAGVPAAPVLALWLGLWVCGALALIWAWREAGWIAPRPAAPAAGPPPGEPAPLYVPRDEERSRWSMIDAP